MQQLNVLLFDIETAPMTVYAWGRRDVNVALNQIKKDWHLLAFAAKKLGAPASSTVYYDQSNAKDISDDKPLLEKIWKLLDEADVVITHNGRAFDSRKLNARFILNGMNPPSPYKHFDTLSLVRNVAAFTSNSLEYLTSKLCTKYKKLNHAKYPGMALWNACLAGDKRVWKEMRKYNIHDVLSLEEFYMKVRSWAPKNSPSMYLPTNTKYVAGCRQCGGSHMRRRGFHYYANSKTQRYQCMDCMTWLEGKKEKL